MGEERPVGVTLLAIWSLIVGAGFLFFGIYLFSLSSVPFYFSLVVFAVGVFSGVAGWGLWSTTEWGWKAGMNLYVFLLLYDVLLYFFPSAVLPEPPIIRFIIEVLIVSYLFDKKEVFFNNSS